ncbi:MAG: DEAD/DEAH box helicase family protein [bacterium]|nr:DEAD/DEAH box helicase family protein [bacterium]
MLELKEYQHRTLAAFARWLTALEDARKESLSRVEVLEGANLEHSAADRNFPAIAWQHLVETGGVESGACIHVGRSDGAGRPIPHVCFKIPTGGGKTLLGTAALERLGMHTGLVLWIVPTRAIYTQTKAAFWSRQHAYRQMLEHASGGRVKVLEKEERLAAGDLENYLCVMLLMLPATNRVRGRDFLRMFRDSGRYTDLFPPEDDEPALAGLLAENPDLECSDDGIVKHSLFNLLKTQRPVVVLDEAHKAYGGTGAKEFVRSVNRLNPQLVIELSATPNRTISNLLVDISGVDLKKEEMIKLPVVVTTSRGEWHDTVARAHDRLGDLTADAQRLHAEEGRYIRPIVVVRVERTGRDQRGTGRIHAEDVRDHLIQQLGEAPEAVRVKSAENDEIAGEDLLSEYSPVRWIITKAALMEGWDCPFAYVLVILDNTRSKTAITQLTGRVMRQPHARRTGVPGLDQCYVHCWQTAVDEAVRQVKSGLEHEGLTGLSHDIHPGDTADTEVRAVRRRARFAGEDIFLPKVLHRHGDGWRYLDYQRHILPLVDWGRITAPADPGMRRPVAGVYDETTSVDIGDVEAPETKRERIQADTAMILPWLSRQLTDIVPNPWQAARIAGEVIESLRARGVSDEGIYADRRERVVGLRGDIANQVERDAEEVFREKLRSGDIRFDLEAREPNFKMPEEFNVPVAADDHSLEHAAGSPVQKSLFDPVLESQFDTDLEKKLAFYIDQHEAIQWWHRVAVRQQHEYYLRGWNQDRIWPDFVATARNGDDNMQLLVVETKGAHLGGNTDTEYKTKVFAQLEAALNNSGTYECGEVSLRNGATSARFKIVFREESFAEVV